MYREKAYIGEYEKSIDKHVDRKLAEIDRAAHLLIDAYAKHGKIAMRWSEADRTKQIRTYQEHAHDPGARGVVVGTIPREYWVRQLP